MQASVLNLLALLVGLGTQFTCFTRAYSSAAPLGGGVGLGTQFTCFTGTKVQALTQKALLAVMGDAGSVRLVLWGGGGQRHGSWSTATN
jgi:hypothetical protein